MAKREQFLFASLFRRRTAIVTDDELVLLEHHFTRDRIRRITLDQVDYILTWKRAAVGRIVALSILTVLLGVASLAIFAKEDLGGEALAVFSIFCGVLAGATIIMLAFTVTMKRNHLLICRAGVPTEISGIMRHAKFQRLLNAVTARTRLIQSQLAATPLESEI